MRTQIYSVYDKRRQVFGPIQQFENEATAVRSMQHFLASHPESIINSNSDDFAMYYLGDFDDCTGDVVNIDCDVVVEFTSLIQEAKNVQKSNE